MAYESTQVNIRSFQLSDADRLDFALHLRDRPESRIKHPDWRSGDGLRSDLPFLTDPDQGFALVAEQDGAITGFVGCSGPVRERTVVRLQGPVVSPRARRMGIGTQLLHRVLGKVGRGYPVGCEAVIWADAANIGARALLKKFGFEITFSEWFMQHGNDAAFTPVLPEGFRVRMTRDRGDVESAYGIYRATWQGRKSVDSFCSDIRPEPNGICLLESGEGTLAFCIVMARSNGNADIEYFAVRPDIRGKGFGKLFLHHALPVIRKEAGDRPVTLTVHTDNDPAIRLYEGAGFKKLYAMDCRQREIGEFVYSSK
jgi:ribosomal protein S18 acetylase RimI-like enzyme